MGVIMSKFLFSTVFFACIATGSCILTSDASSAEPGWSPIVLPTGEYREQIKSMPIELRPYRPLHFYGNTIRRNYYRGNPAPTPRDIVTTATELVRPR